MILFCYQISLLSCCCGCRFGLWLLVVTLFSFSVPLQNIVPYLSVTLQRKIDSFTNKIKIMKKYDLAFLVASLLLGGVSFLGVAVAAGLFTPLTLAGTNLALIGWALLVVAPLVNCVGSIDTFKRY